MISWIDPKRTLCRSRVEILMHCVLCECETPHIRVNGEEVCTGKRPAHPDGPCAKQKGVHEVAA